MRRIFNVFFILILSTTCEALAAAPHEIAGFVLGKNISEFKENLRLDSAIPIRFAEYLKEVEIRNIPGYKSGLIVYGDCASPGRILRIKLKYSDPREKFYNQLLEKFKDRFGQPDKWRGNPFHVMVAWKWSFTDNQGNRIGLILQHNTEDHSQKLGNVVKLYMYNLMEEELECFEAKHPSESKPDREHVEMIENPENWDLFIPK